MGFSIDGNCYDKSNTSCSQNVTPQKPEQLTLNSVFIQQGDKTTTFDYAGTNQNYYRANNIFGDIATKPNEYGNQPKVDSKLKEITQATPEVEDVTVDVTSNIKSDTSRDLQGYDIAAKPSGVGGFKDMNGTDAYKFFLEQNADDFTLRETEYKGQKETKAYFDKTKSDGKVKTFSSEIIDGKEYLAMKDKDGKAHYFSMENGLKETTFEDK